MKTNSKQLFTGAVVGASLLVGGYVLHKCTNEPTSHPKTDDLGIYLQDVTVKDGNLSITNTVNIYSVDSCLDVVPKQTPDTTISKNDSTSINKTYTPISQTRNNSTQTPEIQIPSTYDIHIDDVVLEPIVEIEKTLPCRGVNMSSFNNKSRLKKLGLENTYLENGVDYRTIDVDTLVVDANSLYKKGE